MEIVGVRAATLSPPAVRLRDAVEPCEGAPVEGASDDVSSSTQTSKRKRIEDEYEYEQQTTY